MRQADGGGLVEADGPIEVLEAVLSQVAQRDVEVLLLVFEQRLSGLGDEDLAAVPRRANAGRAMNCQTGVLAFVSRCLAGVDSHTHLDLHAVGPAVGEERDLPFDGSQDCVAGTRERNEEGVALRVDFAAAVGAERGSEHALVLGKHLVVPIPQLLHQPRRALDVREEERDGTGRWLFGSDVGRVTARAIQRGAA